MGILRIMIVSLVLASACAEARPVSWPGGWTIMQRNDFDESRLHIHYSTSAFHSLGLIAQDSHQTETKYVGLQWNHLLKRRNTRYSQANLYFKTQLGVQDALDKQALAATIGIAGDWETRRYFTSYEARYREADNLNERNFKQAAKIGIAPYLAEYGNWHTWLMLKVDHIPDAEDELVLTPLVRLFKGNTLIEAGLSDEEDVLFNWIIRY